jgi:hypothetical protein
MDGYVICYISHGVVGRWLKTTMKEAIAVLGTCFELVKQSALFMFSFMTIEVGGEISLEVFGGSTVCDFLKKSSIFIYLPATDFLCSSRYTEEVVQLGYICPASPAFLQPPT